MQKFTNYPNELMDFDTVLDNTMGSGTTRIACVNTIRKCIWNEIEEKYFKLSKYRIPH